MRRLKKRWLRLVALFLIRERHPENPTLYMAPTVSEANVVSAEVMPDITPIIEGASEIVIPVL